MPSFPMTSVDGIEVSRVIIGSNQFLGYSHYSGARDRWLREYFTPDRMADVMEVYARRGVNAIMAPPRDSIRARRIDITQDRTGQSIHYIATPGKESSPGASRATSTGARSWAPPSACLTSPTPTTTWWSTRASSAASSR